MANLNPIIGEKATVVFNIHIENNDMAGNKNSNINTVYNNQQNRNPHRNRRANRNQRDPYYDNRNVFVSKTYFICRELSNMFAVHLYLFY